MRRCYGCFNLIDENANVCPHCSYPTSFGDYPKWVLRPGTMLNGKYEVGRSLGEGGFGITYLAWDINMETRVAIKEYYPTTEVMRDVTSSSGNTVNRSTAGQYENFDEGMKRYVKEAATLSKFFDLPGIVSVKDFFYENNTAYIVMEYIDGVSLKDFLKQNGEKIPYSEAISLVQPVISSLSVIHANKLLHRDISPDNIMIQYDGKIKLIDFGAARSIENQADNGMTVMLKHGYAPIEQYSRSGAQDAYTDVYGICAVLYRMITGSIPVESTDRAREDTLIPIKKLTKKVPKHIALAIEKGLSVMPQNRQQSMQELYNDLYITKKGLVDRKVDSAYSVLKRVLIILVIVLILIAGFGVFYRLNYDRFDKVRGAVNVLRGIPNEEEDEDLSKESEDSDEYDKVRQALNKDSDEAKSDDGESDVEANKDDVETDASQKRATQIEDTQKDSIENNANDSNTSSNDSISDGDNVLYQKESPQDEEINAAIEAVQKGRLSNNSRMEVGQILDNYSDYAGSWEGLRENNEIYVKYTGVKNNESFAIIFHITSNKKSSTQVYISFELAGALKNNMKVEEYSDFFSEITAYSGL